MKSAKDVFEWWQANRLTYVLVVPGDVTPQDFLDFLRGYLPKCYWENGATFSNNLGFQLRVGFSDGEYEALGRWKSWFVKDRLEFYEKTDGTWTRGAWTLERERTD